MGPRSIELFNSALDNNSSYFIIMICWSHKRVPSMVVLYYKQLQKHFPSAINFKQGLI